MLPSGCANVTRTFPHRTVLVGLGTARRTGAEARPRPWRVGRLEDRAPTSRWQHDLADGSTPLNLGERGDDVTAKQVDRAHDPRMGQVAHLHEAEDLVHAGLLVLLEDLDNAGRVAHGEGAR